MKKSRKLKRKLKLPMSTTGQFLRYKREEAGVSQRKLAKHLGITQGYMSQLENGLHPVRTDFLTKATKFLDR